MSISLRDDLIFLIEGRQLGLRVQRLLDGHLEIIRDELGDTVGFLEGHVQCTPYVADHRFGFHFSERRDLRYGINTVFLAHILDHAGTLVFAEVNVDIGQADAFDIQEAFENEIVGQGIKVCDTQSPRDDRTGRGTTTGTDGMSFPSPS